MALSVFDFLKGLDFTALGNATAADHNALIDSAVPYSDNANEGKGLILWTIDSALNTPRVPDPTTAVQYNKWKRYIWIRLPHSSATSTIPLFYGWNDNATSVATYLKWQRPEANVDDIQAQLDALDLRVDDLEASMATALATANAANSTANLASTNATSALSTANTANANATEALSDLNTATTGVKDRLTAVEADVAAAESNITALQTNVTTINNTLSSGLGPVFITPVTVYSAAGLLVFTTFDVSAQVPSNAKAIILEASQTSGDSLLIYSVNVRRDSISASMLLYRAGTGNPLVASVNVSQGLFPCTAARTFQMEVDTAIASVITVRLVGYYL